jgi:Carboxypeptidase regulatory-like domain/Putative zinc-finger
VNQKLHSGPHPDADQLSIFVEGADAPRERERMLAHLAECQECRDVVFLMRRPVETASVAAEVSKGWVWQRWLLSAGLAGAALAGLALLLIYLRPSATVPENVRQSAEVQQPEIAALGTPLAQSGNSAPVAQAENDKNPLSRVATSTAKQKSEGAAALKAPDVGSHPASADVANPETETRLSSGSTAAIAGAAAAPKPGSDLNSAVAQELPQTGRNITNLQPPPSQPRAQAATPQDNLETQQNLRALRVERDSGQDETLSGVSGRVTDVTGGVIPKATVVLRDASGNTRQIATGADGSFRLTGVSAGHYDLTVTAPGFRSNQQSIDLKSNEVAMLQPVLAPGATTQTVVVTESVPSIATDSASVAAIAANLPSRLPVASSVSLGKRILSLDGAGSLFLSRNAGKSWKKVHPQWSGKAARINLIAAEAGSAKGKSEAPGVESTPSVFQLTTDSGAQWTSKDGTHWRQK